MLQVFKVSATMLVTVLIAACSQGPGDQQIENLVSSHVAVSDIAEVTDFSVSGRNQDGDVLTADVSYTVRYLQNSEEIYQQVSKGALAEEDQMSPAIQHVAVAAVESGTEVPVSGVVTLEKQAGEWQLRQDNE